MATKLSPFKNATGTLKLGERNAEVRAVGAWVEPEYYNRRTIFEAVISAKEEEQRLNQLHYEKQQQLKQFQLDVKKRVQALAKQQRQQQLQKSYQAVEVERNVLAQSAAAAERSTPRKNRCAVRDQESLTVRHSAAKIHSQLQGAVISTIEERMHGSTPQELQRTTDQIHQNTVLARNKLMKCRLGTDVYEDTDLPGGRWTNDVANTQPLTNDIGEHNSSEITKQYTEAPRTVHFELHEEDDTINPGYRNTIHTHSGEITRAPQLAAPPRPSSAFPPPLHPDQLVDDQKHLAMKQRATYRRLFMDIEREQVKENQRRQEHRKHINKFKKDKENERERLEAECWKSLEIADPVSGETMREAELKQQLQQQAIIEEQEARAQRQQKNRDMQRYVEALRCNLRENVTLRGIDLPALCCCGESVWDTNPDTCANNCVFYKNHKAYAKALQALLTSCDVV